jgi:hypothetical protein
MILDDPRAEPEQVQTKVDLLLLEYWSLQRGLDMSVSRGVCLHDRNGVLITGQ